MTEFEGPDKDMMCLDAAFEVWGVLVVYQGAKSVCGLRGPRTQTTWVKKHLFFDTILTLLPKVLTVCHGVPQTTIS